jgi:hypothetical protein
VSPPPADAPTADEEPSAPLLGATLIAGIPSGILLGVVLQPARWVRFYGGPAHNTLAFGGAGGVSFGLFTATFTPTFTVEGGGFGSGDASSIAGSFVHLSSLGSAIAQKVDYDYGSVQAGIRVGWPSLGFFARGGLSYLHANLHNFQAALRSSTGDSSIVAQDPTLQAVIPSVQLGAEVFF